MPAWYDTRIQTARQEPAAPAAVAPEAAPAAPAAPVAPTAPAAPAATPAPAGNAPSRPAAQSGAAKSGERVIGGKTYVRQADGSYKLKE